MNRNRVVQIAALTICAGSLSLSGVLAGDITASASRNKLVYVDRAEENAPPQVALGIAMGAFRGLFVNVLWIRANALKEAGKFHEAMTLARAITALQPRFPEVWAFHAWNMAYNISVTSSDELERWDWVNKGIRLLRDEGVVYNPNDLLVHKELSWIFLHKVAGFSDDANQYYKRAMAAEWTEVLGTPPRAGAAIRTREEATQAYLDWLEPVAHAPQTLEAVFEAEPVAKDLVDALRSRVSDTFDGQFLRQYSIVEALTRSSYAQNTNLDPRGAALAELIKDPTLTKGWGAFLPFIRRRVLIEQYHMDPERMVRYTRKYGPLDWRHPAAHALYWAAKGVEGALQRVSIANAEDFDFINADRNVIQALQELYRSGDISFSYLYFRLPELRIRGESGTPQLYSLYVGMPNPAFIDTYSEVVREVAARSWADQKSRMYGLYAAGYENFLKDAIRFFYRRGELDRANKYQHELITSDIKNINAPTFTDREVATDMDSFIEAQFEDERFKTPYVASSELAGALQSAFVSGLLGGSDELFRRNFEYARTFHRKYIEAQVQPTAAGEVYGRQAVVDPDFRFYAGQAFAVLMSQLDVEDAETVYGRAPEDLRRFGYVVMRDVLGYSQNPQDALGGRRFTEVFPEPPGLKDFETWWQSAIRERTEGMVKPRE
ncbi:MAG: hypothetical protein H6811_04800 [Phycisphaeraceae bacterium]|nr:hypothetical protein [Phycisphaeraceae bacterium]